MTIPRCPQCGRFPGGTCESLTGVALLVEPEEGDEELTYLGETKVNWNDQTTNTNEQGEMEFWCAECDLGWFAPFEGRLL